MVELICCNLSLGYEGYTIAKDINFTLNSGDYLCIVGENGSGKSTLMKALLELKKPTSGSIEYANEVKPTEIGYIPQQTEAQKDFPASVYEVVLSGCLSSLGKRPFYSKKQKESARKNMELLGISALAKRSYRELSGGQQQRVLLARALCAAKRILLLDEPVAGLDPIVTQELYYIIEKLNKEQKMTIVMISHDVTAAVKYASHIFYMGKPCFFGTNKEFCDSRFFKEISKEER